MGPYKIKRIISTNEIELELPSTIKIHPVVNISRVYIYRDQVEGQRKEWPLLVVIKEEEEYKVEKILNKRSLEGKIGIWCDGRGIQQKKTLGNQRRT